MTDRPILDPARSTQIKSMLRSAVEQNAPAARPRRTWLLVALITGAVVLAGGSTAWAVNGFAPFTAIPAPVVPSGSPTPSNTPSPTPSATGSTAPVPTVDPSVPHASFPLDCPAIGDGVSVTTLMPGSADQKADSDVTVATPPAAGVVQSGLTTCRWYSTTPNSYLSISVVADPAAGRQDIDGRRGSGGSTVEVGDGGALSCAGQCTLSFLSGSYWAAITTSTDSENASATLARSAADAVAGLLAQHPTPHAPWQAPASSWAPGGDCAALKTDRPITDVLGAKWLTGPYPNRYQGADPMWSAESHAFDCYWYSADGVSQDPAIITNLHVTLAPGAGWAFPAATASATPVAVSGADAAAMTCGSTEAPGCRLDVLTDGAWMQLGYADGIQPSQQPRLIALAESLIAAHRA